MLDMASPYYQSWRTLLTDNYYTSAALGQELKRCGLYLIGTLRKGRGVPECVDQLSSKPTKTCPKGTMYLAVKDHRGIDMCVVGFMDNKGCFLMDTKYGHDPAPVERKQSDGSIEVSRLVKSVSYYNGYMGGVNQFDQIRSSKYGASMKSRRRKWTVRHFEGLVDMCRSQVVRIWQVMYTDTEKELTHYEVILALQDTLIDRTKNPYILRQGVARPLGGGGGQPSNNAPVQFLSPTKKYYKAGRDREKELRSRRKRCIVCLSGQDQKRGCLTPYRCSACKKAVCKDTDCFGLHLANGSRRRGSKCMGCALPYLLTATEVGDEGEDEP